MTLMQPCVTCGDLSNRNRCEAHRPQHTPKKNAKDRGYDAAWFRLSRRARKLQPFCLDCGTRDDLTGDHSPEAWIRKEKGLPIRLRDIEVRCRSCNSKKGRARPGGTPQTEATGGPRVKASSPSHIMDKEVSHGDQGWAEDSDHC